MWNALRSDLKEFVSTVADDTSNVLSQLDTGLNEGDDNNDDDDDDDPDEQGSNNSKKRAVNHAELKEIMTLLRDHPGTYTEDLADEDDKEAVKTFLAEFSIDAQTDAIAQILEDHQDTVQKHFADLSPTPVSYEDFWKRYFYRCDEERIAQNLAEETERARQARAEAIQGGINAVTNLFGGVAKAVTNTIAPEASPGGTTGGQAADGKINFFGAGGRPPFVMNTAMDESGASDDEEDMGWGDDDSEEDLEFDDQGPSEVDSKTEQIEFTDKVSEDLQEKLKQATEERDQIQQTVHLQAEEIKVLKEKLEGGTVDATAAANNAAEVDELKLKLFEKEAELAAVKSKDNDDDMDESGHDISSLTKTLSALPEDQLAQIKSDVFGISDEIKQVEAEQLAGLEKQVQELTETLAFKEAALAEATTKAEDSGEAEKLVALEHQVQELTVSLATKDATLSEVNEMLATTSKELEASRSQLSSDQANAANADSALENLEAALQSVQSSLDALQLEHESLQQSSQQAQADSASQLSALEASHAEQMASLTAQLEQANQKVRQGEDALKEKEAELSAAKEQVVAPMPPSTPDSMSTGVNVEAPTPAFTTPRESNDSGAGGDDDEEGDDWGDDWD